MLRLWAGGDAPAGDRLFAIVYDELRTIAHRQRRRWHGDDTLDTTALVHEVYLRLRGTSDLAVRDRAHFFAIAASASRQILSNYARRRLTDKRGGSATTLSMHDLGDAGIVQVAGDTTLVDRTWDLEVALTALQAIHPRPCQVVECRYFGGLSLADTATAIGVSEATVKRDWALAQAWLYRALHMHAPDFAPSHAPMPGSAHD